MFRMLAVAQPDTLAEAYKILTAKRFNTVLGGCAWLRMGSLAIPTGVDLAKLNLTYINDFADTIEIGAMATLRAIEKSRALTEYGNGILPQAVSNIIGVQFRNVATVGGSVFARFGFSDVITALLALDAEVELYKGGRMSLAEFLDKPRAKDLLIKVIIHKTERTAAYQALRNSASDFPILNVAVSRLDAEWKIAVGARPAIAKLAVDAAKLLTDGVTPKAIETAAQAAAAELSFGDNMRASAKYRQEMCKVLVRRAIAEVAACK